MSQWRVANFHFNFQYRPMTNEKCATDFHWMALDGATLTLMYMFFSGGGGNVPVPVPNLL